MAAKVYTMKKSELQRGDIKRGQIIKSAHATLLVLQVLGLSRVNPLDERLRVYVLQDMISRTPNTIETYVIDPGQWRIVSDISPEATL